MAGVKTAGNMSVTYDGVDITAYCNTASISASISELDTTDLASTAMEYIPGLADFTVALEINNYDTTVDTATFLDLVVTPTTLKTLVIVYTDAAAGTATYTWTTNVFPTSGEIGGGATDLISISGFNLRCNGAPSRVIA